MELIRISKDRLVNPDHIIAVELRNLRKGQELVVIVGSRVWNVDVSATELLDQLKRAGVSPHEQFFAG